MKQKRSLMSAKPPDIWNPKCFDPSRKIESLSCAEVTKTCFYIHIAKAELIRFYVETCVAEYIIEVILK